MHVDFLLLLLSSTTTTTTTTTTNEVIPLQDRTIQYNTITHITQNNIQHSRQLSIRKNYKKKIIGTKY